MVYLEARDDLVATAAYQPVPAAVAAARRFVRDTLRSWELPGDRGSPGERAEWTQRDALVDDAVLLTSELVTNAVLHAGTPVQVTCRLLGDLSGGAVEMAVLDRRPAQLRPDRPHTAAEAAERTNGRGLQLPSELATAWGVTYARAGQARPFRCARRSPSRSSRTPRSAGRPRRTRPSRTSRLHEPGKARVQRGSMTCSSARSNRHATPSAPTLPTCCTRGRALSCTRGRALSCTRGRALSCTRAPALSSTWGRAVRGGCGLPRPTAAGPHRAVPGSQPARPGPWPVGRSRW